MNTVFALAYCEAEMATAVAKRSAPASLVTLSEVYEAAARATESDTAPLPPKITIDAGRRRRSSAAAAGGSAVGATSSTGPPRTPLAGAAASASGKAVPVAR